MQDMNDEEFRAWLKRQGEEALAGDIVLYGTPTMTALMSMNVSRSGPPLIENVIVSAYPEARMVTVTFPYVHLDGETPITVGGVVREVPVPPVTAERPFPLGEIFSREVGLLARSGWKAIDESERG